MPSWVDQPEQLVPRRYHALLRQLTGGGDGGGGTGGDDGGGGGATPTTTTASGTLLVCPLAARVRGADILRDFAFDGLSLAFLKNLQQLTLVSAPSLGSGSGSGYSSADGANGDDGGGASSATTATTATTREYRIESNVVFERSRGDEGGGGGGDDAGGFGGAMLRGVSVVSHQLSHVTIVERSSASSNAQHGVVEVRRQYRLHKYKLHQYRSGGGVAPPPPATIISEGATPKPPGAALVPPPTTTITLAFPVGDDGSPQRSSGGEQLVFAYLPVTAAGFSFAMHADFELVASRQVSHSEPQALSSGGRLASSGPRRAAADSPSPQVTLSHTRLAHAVAPRPPRTQDVSDTHAGNHVLLGRIPKLFVHAVLSDPQLGEDAFATCAPHTLELDPVPNR